MAENKSEENAEETLAGNDVPKKGIKENLKREQPGEKKGKTNKLTKLWKNKKIKIAILSAAGLIAAAAVYFIIGGSSENSKPQTMTNKTLSSKPAAQVKPVVQAKDKAVGNINKKEKNPLSETEIKIRKMFTEALNDSDWRTRRDAVNALGELGWPKYIPELKRLSRDKNREVKNAAAKAIIMIYSKNQK